MNSNHHWHQVGEGKKIHAFYGNPRYSLCGVGGEISPERDTRDFPICKNCQRMLNKKNKWNIAAWGPPV
jgi:hypothetical protein